MVARRPTSHPIARSTRSASAPIIATAQGRVVRCQPSASSSTRTTLRSLKPLVIDTFVSSIVQAEVATGIAALSLLGGLVTCAPTALVGCIVGLLGWAAATPAAVANLFSAYWAL